MIKEIDTINIIKNQIILYIEEALKVESWKKLRQNVGPVTARPSKASRRLPRHIARKRRSFISVQRSRKNGELGFERQTRGPVVREVPAGAAQHAHEVAVSCSYGSVRLRRRRRQRRRRRLGTCLTKHSCGRYLVHARTDEWGPLGTERCAQNMGYSSAYRDRRRE